MIPRHVRAAANATRHTLQHHGDDPLSPRAINTFSRSYYWRRDLATGGLDAPGVMNKLAGAHQRHNYPYATIAEAMRLIPDDGASIIVAREPEAQAALIDLAAGGSPSDMRKTYRTLQQYTVQIPENVAAELVASGDVVPVLPDADDSPLMLANMDLYRDDVGLDVL